MIREIGLFFARLLFSVLSRKRDTEAQVFKGKQYAVNNVDWKCCYMFGVKLSVIESNKNTAAYYPLEFDLF